MTSYSGATSRRSHTKSRKGCKTCKRRHIRCDETFPQCRNCSKHQVRCDYMDTAGESQLSASASSDLYWSSDVESVLDHWQRTGHCSAGERFIDLQSSGHVFSKSDLHLIYNALWFSGPNDTTISDYTVWTTKTPRFLDAAADTSFLLHAILGFGALALAWERNSADAKSLAYQQSALALQGLQTATSSFSRENADAVLAASVLLSWQANDCWVSLTAGIQNALSSLSHWRLTSKLRDAVTEFDGTIPTDFYAPHHTRHHPEFAANYAAILHATETSLDQLAPHVVGSEESTIIDNLREYVQRLLSVSPAQRPEVQFHHLYALRKWLFWLPPSRLQSGHPSQSTMVALAYLYAVAVAIEPLFPEVAPAFCSAMAIGPLENLLRGIRISEQVNMENNSLRQNIGALTAWPQQIATTYRSRKMQTTYDVARSQGPSGLHMLAPASSNSHDIYTLLRPTQGYVPASSGPWLNGYETSTESSTFSDLTPMSHASSPMSRPFQATMLPHMSDQTDGGSDFFPHSDVDLSGLVHTPLTAWT